MPNTADPSEIQTRIAQIWTEVLDVPAGQEGLGFFELGGQSISALLIVAWLEDELGITSVGVGDLFDDPNLQSLTRQVLAELELAA